MSEKLLGFVGSDAMMLLVWAVVGLVVLFGLLAFLSRRPRRGRTSGPHGPRLAIVDEITLDDRRRLVLIRRDEVEHLIVVGGASEIVVESGIGRPRPVPEHRAPAPVHTPEPISPPPARPAAVPPPGSHVSAAAEPRPAPRRIEPLVAAPRPSDSGAPTHQSAAVHATRDLPAERTPPVSAPTAESAPRGLLWKFGFGSSSGNQAEAPRPPRDVRSSEPTLAQPSAPLSSEPVRLDVPFAGSPAPASASFDPSKEDTAQSLKHLESEMTDLLARTPPPGQR